MLLACVAGAGALAQENPLDRVMTRALPDTSADILPAHRVAMGVYDPKGAFTEDRAVEIEHIFVYWQALDFEGLRKSLDRVERGGRALLITVEPYTRAENWRDGGEHLFSDILSGEFDREIETVCDALRPFRGNVLIRWGHEMEDPSGRYPWARHDSKGYKAAFRYFVQSCRRHLPGAAFVWSPKGEKNLKDYYPGDAYVDYVGLSLWGLQTYDRKFHDGDRAFAETFREKYERVASFPHPVLIAELGVSGDDDYRSAWFTSLFSELAGSPGFGKLRAVVYFNDREPWQWPLGLGLPDWRVASDWFSTARQAAEQRAAR